MSVISGTVSWTDLSTTDIEGAQRFYAELLGWELTTQHTDMGDYTVATVDGREVAGMMAQAPELAGAPATWTVFVVVDDLTATLGAIERAGGSVHQTPFDIPGGARVAVVSDRSGAMLALISGGPEPGHPYFAEQPGMVCWAELMTADVEAAVGFYGEVFDWRAETDDDGPVPYTLCRLGHEPVAGIIGRPPNLPTDAPDTWSVYFSVDDCSAVIERAVELGGSVILPPTPTPMGPFAVVADPEGAAFQIMEMAPADPTGVDPEAPERQQH